MTLLKIVVPFQNQILLQISKRIDLSIYTPLSETDEGFKLWQQHIASELLSNRYSPNYAKVSFLQSAKRAQYIEDSFIKPLYKKYSFSTIGLTYVLTDTSNKDILFTSSNVNSVNKFLDGYISLHPNKQKSQYKIITRYNYSPTHTKLLDLTYADVPFSDTFNGARRALRHLDTPRSILKEYMRWCGVPDSCIIDTVDYSIQIVLPFFDDVKKTIHANINNLPPEFRYYLDIPTIAGFPPMKYRKMTDDPHLWLTDITHSSYSAKWWADAFNKTFGQTIIKTPDYLPTIEEFTHNRWLWVTTGATRFSKLVLDGAYVKTKFGAATSLSNSELDELVHKATVNIHKPESTIGVFIKPDEKGFKRRLIANVPLGGYILASYIRFLVTRFTGDYPAFATLNPSTRQMVDVFRLLQSGQIFYPLDESSYDYNVSRESWDGFFLFLDSIFPHNKGVRLFKTYFDRAIWAFDGKEGKWNAGMPSGLALTSFLNSWMNYIKQQEIIPGVINWAAGDDVLAVPYRQKTLEQISDEYKTFGSVSNPIKNWFSDKYAEYLKRIYSARGSSGYPARIYSSLIWAGTERFFLPTDRLAELYELFKQFFDRLGLPMDERYVAKDLARAVSNKISNFNMYTALDWLHSPRVHGGAGRLPYNNLTFTWNVQNKHFGKIENNLIRIPRNISYSGAVTLTIGTYRLQSNVGFRLGPSYRLLPIENIQQWEARLNREDITYKGPFSSLVLDVIPLPSVDFISTSLMSQIAADFDFNSYPNLTGSWNAIASRLILASKALVQKVVSLMHENSLITLI